MILQSFLIGWAILIGAIIINIIAKSIGLSTWYDFLEKKKARWYEYIFLFVLYPFLLGLIAYLVYAIVI